MIYIIEYKSYIYNYVAILIETWCIIFKYFEMTFFVAPLTKKSISTLAKTLETVKSRTNNILIQKK